MGVKGKLIASVEVKCEGNLIHELFHIHAHHVPNISPNIINHFEIHEGETVKVGSVVSWSYNEAGQKRYMKQLIEDIDPDMKLIRWKAIEGDVLESYNSFTIVTFSEHEWTTWTIEYEKKTEGTPEPLVLLGLVLDMTKDIEAHLLKK
ncbi:hypothetical protein CQW23_12111 [Capsicum baccatum]|uniref:Bet v I/Major latex protein domain-containing protein n=1 Tax=Capsicum baccatum TaxID=33114 RepID=A0A2G2WRN9_CAPBA|nr:hypothetical protein CQW23_12111 [Capsicum baccatum]